MNLNEYLKRHGEQTPTWLAEFQKGDALNHRQFFASRLVFYPGSGTDGQPVKVFATSHAAHCFVYADYGINQGAVEADLDHPGHCFRGYHTLARVQLNESDLVPCGWSPSIAENIGGPDMSRRATCAPFGFVEILERNDDLDDRYGADRLAILFLGADGIAAYDALFRQQSRVSAPFAVVLQDHGFGGNYDKFGRGGLLERIASRSDTVPRWLIVAEKTRPWEGFERVPEVDGDTGGMHSTIRFLYERCDE